MDDQGFEFVAHDQDGYRLIRTVLPATATTQSLSVVIDRYLAMWDTDLPIYIVNDATRLAGIESDVAEVLLAILKRNLLDSRFRASSWYTGDNPVLTVMASNMKIQHDKNLNCMPHKANSIGRIDGMAALIMAIGRWTAAMSESQPGMFLI